MPPSSARLREKDTPYRVKDLVSTASGDLWATLWNGTIIKQGGISAFRPGGSLNKWTVLPITGKRVISRPDGVLVETNDGQLLQQEGLFFYCFLEVR